MCRKRNRERVLEFSKTRAQTRTIDVPATGEFNSNDRFFAYEAPMNDQEAHRTPHSMTRQFGRNYLRISLIPFLLLLISMAVGAVAAKHYWMDPVERSMHALGREAGNELQLLGEKIIRNKARDVAREVAIYLQAHPGLSVESLAPRTDFRDIATQKVGESGYTCLYEAGTGIMRVHPNAKLINRDLHALAAKLPSWWSVFEPALAGRETAGYYDWLEPDGSRRKKYMAITPVPARPAGKTLMVAATTYIDEFYKPIYAMHHKVAQTAAAYRTFFNRRGAAVAGAAIVLLLITFACVYFLGSRSALSYIRPIEKLAKAAKYLAAAHWEAVDTEGPMFQRKDEIGILAQEFLYMQQQLKSMVTCLEEQLTELRRTQMELEKSESHYHSLFDGMPVGLYRTTPDGRIVDANPKLVQMLGYPDRETFLACDATEVYADDDGRGRWQAHMEKSRDFHRAEIRMRRYDGGVIWVENYSRAVRDADGRILFYEGSLKDITEAKCTEAALMESQAKYKALYEEAKRAEEVYRSLLNSSADAIVIYDMQGRTKYISPAFCSLFGWSLAELEGRRIPFVPDSEQERTAAVIRDLVESGKGCQGFETRRYTRDGKLLEVSISASRFDDHAGAPAGILVMIRDISERRSLEMQLLRAQKMEAIGTLAGGIAHDFNNLMMGILGNISLMLFDTPESHPHHVKLRNIEKQIHHGARLTNQLLGYARKGKYEIEPFDFNELIRETAETFARTHRQIKLDLKLDAHPSAIKGDAGQLELVLLNLFVNAGDAMPGGGRLSIQTANLNHREIGPKPYRPKPGDYVMLEVEDTGTGMHADTVARIFDPFFTTKEMGRGTGLGLASAYGIIKGHGGYIDVDSVIDRGTVFRVYLPASADGTATAPEPAAAIEKGSGTVLLVDDEETVLEVGCQMLSKLNYRVLAADGGTTAIERYTAARDEIDLVILDMVMPDKGGGEVYDELKALNPEVKVLLSSGYSLDSQARAILQRGCNGFIQKPFNMQALSQKIAQVMNA